MTCALCGRVEDYIRHDVGFFGSHTFIPAYEWTITPVLQGRSVTPRWEDLITGADALWAHQVCKVRLD